MELASWWRIYNDKRLDTLIEKATHQNFDLRKAGLKILQARALYGVSKGFYYPQLQRLNGSYSAIYSDELHSTGSIGFDLGWEIDLWGKYARGVEAAEASVYASVAGYRDALVLITAEVARNYINYQTTKERIEYAKRNIAIQDRIEKITRLQYRSGNVSELDMQQARTQLYNTRASLPALELSQRNTINALAFLLATTPEEIEEVLEEGHDENSIALFRLLKKGKSIKLDENDTSMIALSFVPLPKFDPYKKIDASLLSERPDVKAAEYLAKAQNARIGQAKADLYPSFTLFGSISYSAVDTASSGMRVSAGPGISWNVFQYGRIKNRVRLEDAKLQEALVQYSKQLLKASNEVTDALNAYIYTQKQLKEREKALQATVRAFNISVAQYQDGLVSYQRLLSTVEKLTLTQDIYAQTKGVMATDIALLYKALGGGWQRSQKRSYLFEEDRRQIEKRGVDWDEHIEERSTQMPEGWR